MFLFISKLLPLFFYPLGATCFFLLVALGLWWRNSKWTPAAVAAALTILLLSSNAWTSNWLAQSLEWRNIPTTELPTADALVKPLGTRIVILGGATRSQAYPRPDVDFADSGDSPLERLRQRVWYGATLDRAGKAPKIIVSGGRIAWKGGGTPEAEDLTKLLVTMGVPKSDIIPESNSFNTRDNAVNVQQILKERNFKQILLVTSAMHMPRSMAIFKRVGINEIAAPTDYRVSQLEIDEPNSRAEATILSFLPSEDCLSLTTQAIREYIGIVVYTLRGWI